MGKGKRTAGGAHLSQRANFSGGAVNDEAMGAERSGSGTPDVGGDSERGGAADECGERHGESIGLSVAIPEHASGCDIADDQLRFHGLTKRGNDGSPRHTIGRRGDDT